MSNKSENNVEDIFLDLVDVFDAHDVREDFVVACSDNIVGWADRRVCQ